MSWSNDLLVNQNQLNRLNRVEKEHRLKSQPIF